MRSQVEDEQDRASGGIRGRAAEAFTRRDAEGPPLPAIAVRGVAATFLVALVVASLTVGAFVWIDGATPHLVSDHTMSGTLERGDVAIVRPDSDVHPGAVVRWVDSDGAAHLHRVRALQGDEARLSADVHGAAVAVVPADRLDGVAERRVPLLGLPLVWVREGAVGGLFGFTVLVAASIGTLVAVPLRAGVVGEREAPRRDPATDPARIRENVDDYFTPSSREPQRGVTLRRSGRRRSAA